MYFPAIGNNNMAEAQIYKLVGKLTYPVSGPEIRRYDGLSNSMHFLLNDIEYKITKRWLCEKFLFMFSGYLIMCTPLSEEHASSCP
jgi:hypothetical protein